MRQILLLSVLCSTISGAAGEGLYSYVDRGTRVITNLGGSRSSLSEAIAEDLTKPYLSLIRDLSERHEVDEHLVRAIVQIESNYDPFAVSPKGCKGLMQLHPDTAHRFGVDDIFHPEDNLNGGIKYLVSLIGRFNGDLPLVLAAYNAGENAVIRHQGIPPYEETVNYVEKVESLYEIYLQENTSSIKISQPGFYRIVFPDGRILLTDRPDQLLESD